MDEISIPWEEGGVCREGSFSCYVPSYLEQDVGGSQPPE